MAYSVPGERDELSAYLDGELSSGQRAALEKRLALDPALRVELDHLRETKQILHATPTLDIPRNFTLDPVRYRRPLVWWADYRAIERLGALGAVAAVLLITFGLLLSSATPNASAPQMDKSHGTGNVAILPTVASRVATATASTRASGEAQSNLLAPSVTTPTSLATATTEKQRSTSSPSPSGLTAPRLAATSVVSDNVGGAAPAPAVRPSEGVPYAAAGAPIQSSPPPAAAAQSGAVASAPTNSPVQKSVLPALTPTALAVPTLVPPSATAPAAAAGSAATTATAKTAAGAAGTAVATLVAAEAMATTTPLATATLPPTATEIPRSATPSTPLPLARLITALGIALLVLGIMVLGIGWLRSRL
ncbi:MAG TPA: hypothetical protein VMT34_13740 [Aggregatilineales bacterium]|nr:hypothetical protein [Aggregatilineales bacterium]